MVPLIQYYDLWEMARIRVKALARAKMYYIKGR